MRTSEQINELAAALAKAQGEIQPALKDKTNPAFRSRYADLASVWDACRQALTSHGLAVVQAPTDVGEGRVGLVTRLMHTSGQWLESTISAPLVKNDPQGVGSALTYLRRYALAAIVGVVADEDDDGNRASGQGQQRQQAPARYEPPAPAPAPAQNGMTVAQARERFIAKFGAWKDHYSLPEPRDVAGWVNAGRELAERQQRTPDAPPTQQLVSDEWDAIDAAGNTRRAAVAGVAK